MALPDGREIEELHDAAGVTVGRVVRVREPVDGVVRVDTEWAGATGVFLRVRVVVENDTDWSAPDASRDDMVRRAFVAVHTLLSIEDGAFVSLLDPPEEARIPVARVRTRARSRCSSVPTTR